MACTCVDVNLVAAASRGIHADVIHIVSVVDRTPYRVDLPAWEAGPATSIAPWEGPKRVVQLAASPSRDALLVLQRHRVLVGLREREWQLSQVRHGSISGLPWVFACVLSGLGVSLPNGRFSG